MAPIPSLLGKNYDFDLKDCILIEKAKNETSGYGSYQKEINLTSRSI